MNLPLPAKWRLHLRIIKLICVLLVVVLCASLVYYYGFYHDKLSLSSLPQPNYSGFKYLEVLSGDWTKFVIIKDKGLQKLTYNTLRTAEFVMRSGYPAARANISYVDANGIEHDIKLSGPVSNSNFTIWHGNCFFKSYDFNEIIDKIRSEIGFKKNDSSGNALYRRLGLSEDVIIGGDTGRPITLTFDLSFGTVVIDTRISGLPGMENAVFSENRSDVSKEVD